MLLPIDYKFPESKISIKNIFSNYKNNPLIPKSIVYVLKDLDLESVYERVSNNKIESHNTVNQESIKYDVPINVEKIKLNSSFEKGYILLATDECELCEYYINFNDEELYSGIENIVINADVENPYQDWETFQKFCYKLIQEIKKWLEYNQVKDVNLPDLDNTNNKEN